MKDIQVLWLDDDSPIKDKKSLLDLSEQFPEIKLTTAISCDQSEKLLKSMSQSPDWAIIDLIVPQGDWHDEEYYQVPGIHYIKHLKDKFGDNINIFAFSVMINEKIEEKVKMAGGREAFVKSGNSLAGVLEKIVKSSDMMD